MRVVVTARHVVVLVRLPDRCQHLGPRHLPARASGTVGLLPAADLEPDPVTHPAPTEHGGVVVQGAVKADRDSLAVLDNLGPRLALMNGLRDPRILTRHRPVQVVPGSLGLIAADRRVQHVLIDALGLHPAQRRVHRRAIHLPQLLQRVLTVRDVDLPASLAMIHIRGRVQLPLAPRRQLLLGDRPTRLQAYLPTWSATPTDRQSSSYRGYASPSRTSTATLAAHTGATRPGRRTSLSRHPSTPNRTVTPEPRRHSADTPPTRTDSVARRRYPRRCPGAHPATSRPG